MTHRLLRVLSTALALVLAGCATHVDLAPDEGQPALRVQQRLALTPSNGGLQITPDDLRAGDIVLSSTHSIVSMGVRLITVAPVSHAGKKYNTAGIVLQAPFSIGRQYCELPLIPGLVRDYCIRGLAAIQLGAVKNDRFFCSQFVLEAYRHARLPLTTADPRLISPADLLHMREGDVPSVRTEQALQYVGHLKTAPMPSDEMAVGLAD